MALGAAAFHAASHHAAPEGGDHADDGGGGEIDLHAASIGAPYRGLLSRIKDRAGGRGRVGLVTPFPELAMRVDRLFTRTAIATRREASLAEAAASMQRFGVGMLLVVQDGGDGVPIGIVTDRDIALQGFASESCRVASVMTPVVATVAEHADVHEALEIMRAHGVRRLVVTDAHARVSGVLSIDDIVDGLAADLAAAAAVLKGEIRGDSAGLGRVKVGV